MKEILIEILISFYCRQTDLERLVWACIKTYDTYHGKETKTFQDFVDEIENYETYVMSGVVILEQIINANKATVQNESDEVITDDKKKEA